MSEENTDQAPLFIVGCERSGTTMLQKLISQHPLIWVPREESFFIPRLFPEVRKLIVGGRKGDAARIISNEPLVRKWGVELGPEDVPDGPPEWAYAAAISTLMMRKAHAEGKCRWAEKTPSYVFSIDLLNRMFPQARFLFLVRDGRDVCLSLAPLAWGPNNAYGVARHWVNVYDSWLRASSGLGRRALLMRYEDFLKTPEFWMAEIGRLIGQEDLGHCLEGFRVKQGNSEKWRNNFFFSASERRVFEAVAGPILARLGYKVKSSRSGLPLYEKMLWSGDDLLRHLSNRILRRHNWLSNE